MRVLRDLTEYDPGPLPDPVRVDTRREGRFLSGYVHATRAAGYVDDAEPGGMHAYPKPGERHAGLPPVRPLPSVTLTAYAAEREPPDRPRADDAARRHAEALVKAAETKSRALDATTGRFLSPDLDHVLTRAHEAPRRAAP